MLSRSISVILAGAAANAQAVSRNERRAGFILLLPVVLNGFRSRRRARLSPVDRFLAAPYCRSALLDGIRHDGATRRRPDQILMACVLR
jgi:hypothetical protein